MKSPAPEFDQVTTRQLLAMRQQMIDGNEQVGYRILEGTASGEMLEGAHMRAALVERVDAVLLSRGEKVDPPFWAE